MSISGNGPLSIRKKDVKESKSISTGFRNLKFAHKAAAGETGIDLTALTLPSELNGFTNPSSSTLLGANLRRNRDNLRIVSSLRGELLDYTSYQVTNTRVNFVGFTAEQDEIFVGYIDSAATNGIQVVAAQPIVSTGELAVGATDYNVGELFTVNANSTKQVGDVEVYRNGIQQFRCVGNDLANEGNYVEVNNGTGKGQIIRFKNAPSGQPDAILVVSVSSLAEKPNDSQLAQIETVAGQVDRITEVLSEELELPSTEFQTAPNYPDLKQFGDKVLDLEEPVVGGPKLSTTTEPGAQKLNKVQTKILSATVTSDGAVADLTFNNLIPGKQYEVRGLVAFITDLAIADFTCTLTHQNGSAVVHRNEIVMNENTETGNDSLLFGVNYTFEADADTLTFVAGSISTGSRIVGDGTRNFTYMQLEERNDLVETTDYT